MWYELFSIVAPLFFCAGLGFVWARMKWPFDNQMVTPLSMNVAVPCLVFASISTLKVDPLAFAELVAAVIVCMAAFMALGVIVVKLARLPLATFLPVLMFPNTGNMGLPLCLFAFGDVGLAFGMAWYVIASIMHFTVGVWIASGVGSPMFILKTPLPYALAAGLVFMVSGTPPPKWLHNTVQLLGSLGIPLMLLALGVSLSRLRIVGVWRAAALSVVRLGGGALIGFGVAELFGLTGIARGVLILDAAMPAAVFNYMIAERYRNNAAEVASIIVVSTVLAFAAMPALILALLPLRGY